MTVNKSFVLTTFLITSGFLLCTSLLTDKELKERRTVNRVVGVHLGATYSSIGVYKHPRLERFSYCRPRKRHCAAISLSDIMEVVENEQGSKTMPSCVSFTDSGILIGEPAKAQEAADPKRTVCGINRLIGKRFDDAEVQSNMKDLTYKVVNQENRPYVEVKLKSGDTKLYSPVEILAMILGRLKEMAEKYMGNEVEFAVILVQQGYFDDEVQKQIEEASSMAGIKRTCARKSTDAIGLVRHMLWFRPNLKGLVYDLGGSAFGAAVVGHDNDAYEVITAKADANLGGQTFDTRVLDYFIQLIKINYNKDISKDLRSIITLRTECEKAKIRLSNSNRVMIKIDFSLDDDEILHFEEPLTRKMFEELNMDLFNKTIELVKDAMEEAGVEKTDLDEIILVGGSTHIPMIQHLLKNLFGRKPLNVSDSSEALTIAATKMAGEFMDRSYATQRIQNALSVGIETFGGVMMPIVLVDTLLPEMKSKTVTTYHDGQTTVEIKVFEGETLSTKRCHYLTSFQLSGIPPAPRGVAKIEVAVEVYNDWSIRVTAEHKATNKKNFVTIHRTERHTTMEKLSEAYSVMSQCYPEYITIRDTISEFQPDADHMTVAAVDRIDWYKYSV